MTLFQPPKFYPFGSSRSLRTLRACDYNNFNLTPFSAFAWIIDDVATIANNQA